MRIDLPSTRPAQEVHDADVRRRVPGGPARADGLNETLTRSVPAASRVTVTAKAWYDIEEGYDFLYGEYSLDGGASWQRVGSPVDRQLEGQVDDAAVRVPRRTARRRCSGSATRPTAACTCPVRSSTTSRSTGRFTDDVENGPNGWTATGRWTINTGTVTNIYRAVLPRREPAVQGLGRRPCARPVPVQQGIHRAELGRVLQVPERHARLVRRRLVRGQQHHRAPRWRRLAAGRRSPGEVQLPGRDGARATGGSRSTRPSARR